MLWLAVPARAQLFADDDARKAILDLRNRFTQAEEQAKARQADLNEQIQTLRRSLLEMNNQIETQRAEIARLRGSNEQLLRDVAELQKRERDLGQALDDRLRKIEPQKVALDGQEFLADPEEKRQFDDAMALLRGGEFDKAAQAFAAFQKRWPAGGYADAARFWQGNALYGKRDYAQAIAAFRAYLAKAWTDLSAHEALLRETAARVAEPDDTTVLAVLATKAGCNEAALRVTETALRVTGGAGFSRQVGVDRPYRDARAGFVMAPTSDALFDFTGRALCGLDLF